jgi:hypothetical protein
VAEHRLALAALQVLAEAQRWARFLERLVQHPAAPDQLAPADVLSFEPRSKA